MINEKIIIYKENINDVVNFIKIVLLLNNIKFKVVNNFLESPSTDDITYIVINPNLIFLQKYMKSTNYLILWPFEVKLKTEFTNLIIINFEEVFKKEMINHQLLHQFHNLNLSCVANEAYKALILKKNYDIYYDNYKYLIAEHNINSFEMYNKFLTSLKFEIFKTENLKSLLQFLNFFKNFIKRLDIYNCENQKDRIPSFIFDKFMSLIYKYFNNLDTLTLSKKTYKLILNNKDFDAFILYRKLFDKIFV